MALETSEDDVQKDGEWPPADAAPPPSPRVHILIEGDSSDPFLLRTTMRLLLGSAAEGGDQFLQRLRQWQEEIDRQGPGLYARPPFETEGQRMRYAMLGVLARSTDAAQTAATLVLGSAEVAFNVANTLLSPVTKSPAAQPLVRRYDRLAARGQRVVERWIDRGRAEEVRSRALARQAANQGTDEALDQVMDKLAHDESVRELVTQQSMGVADEVVDAVRIRTARADTAWERRLRSLFGRH